MRLAAARWADAGRVHGAVGGGVVKIRVGAPDIAGGLGQRGRQLVGAGHMVVRRHFRDVQGMRAFAAELAQGDAIAHVHGRAALQVRQSEVHSAVAAVGGAQNRKQRLVLVDGLQLSVAERPSLGRKIPTDDFDFGQKWL